MWSILQRLQIDLRGVQGPICSTDIIHFNFTILNYNVINKASFFTGTTVTMFSNSEWILLSYWQRVSLNDPVDTSSATQGRAGSFILSAVHIPTISECGSMLGFTALHPWNDCADKDSVDCQSETISKEIPSVITPPHHHPHTTNLKHQLRTEWEEMERVGGGAPELMELWERNDIQDVKCRRVVTEMDRLRVEIALDNLGGLKLFEFFCKSIWWTLNLFI